MPLRRTAEKRLGGGCPFTARKTPDARRPAVNRGGREKEKGIGTKMRVKLAAKMLVIAWTLMKKKEKFDPGCLGL